MSGIAELVREFLSGYTIDDSSTYQDSTGDQITTAKEYNIAEILISGGRCYVYKYALVDGDGNPSETVGRSVLKSFVANAVEVSKISVNINRATSGIYPRLSNTKLLYVWAEKYSTKESAFKLATNVILRTKNTDTLESDPPVNTDKSGIIQLIDQTVITRLMISFRTDETLSSNVEIPFDFVVRRLA